ncbi:hypothetical protein [Neisseria yangbaofengii]|uniref:hypothetical protein n=1 Tax=Neisseria yangbaofengii TaxID=2709396 RepID=UPI0013EAED81|nr:hypothetical protein [Neisseria yangbaofengii]
MANHTDLKGGIITATETAETAGRNRFQTASIGHSDIENHSRYEGDGFGIGVSGSISGQSLGQTAPAADSRIQTVAGKNGIDSSIGYGSDGDNRSSITRSGIGTRNIIIGNDTDGTQAAAAYTATRTETAEQNSGRLNNIFDKERVQSEIDLQRSVSQEFGKNAAQGVARLSDYLGNTQDFQRAEILKSAIESELASTQDAGRRETLQQALNQTESYLEANRGSYETWKEGGVGRSILHAGVGGLLTGDVAGAVGAGGAAAAAPYLEKATENLSAIGKAAVDTVGGAALGYVLGGHPGAVTGANADWNNRQLHPSETRVLNRLKQGKTAEEQRRLNAAACALVRCAEGVPTSDPYYRQLSELQKSGERYQTEKNLLLKSGNGLFEYGFWDGANDMRSSYDRAITKGKGIVNMGAGAAVAAGSAAGGVALCTTGIGCIGGAGIAALGITGGYAQSKHGAEQLFGTYRSNWGRQVIDSLGTPIKNRPPLVQDAADITLWSAETLVGRKFSQLTGQKSIDRYIQLQKRQSSVLPDNYIYDEASKTFIGPKGGRSVATTYKDGSGNTVYRRIDGNGQPQNSYYVVNADGKQVAVRNPDPTPKGQIVTHSRNLHEESIKATIQSFENQNVRVTTNVSIQSPNAAQRSVIDQVLNGQPNQNIPVPQGYTVTDIATGRKVSTIKLDDKGFAGLEMKTGVKDRALQRSQAINYLEATKGNAVSIGNKAIDAGLRDGIVPAKMYLIEPNK